MTEEQEPAICVPKETEEQEPAISVPKVTEEQEPVISVPMVTEEQEPAVSASKMTEEQEPAVSASKMTAGQEPAISVPKATERQEPAISAPKKRELPHGWNWFLSSGILLLLAIGLFVWAAVEHNEALRSLSFKQTGGKIMSTHPAVGQKPRSVIEYTYEVAGKKYISNVVSFRAAPIDDNDRESFPLRSQVRVYYDANNPAKSCLQPGEGGKNILACLVAGVLLFVAIGLFAIGFMWNLTKKWASEES